jgi:hypothetical protein
MIAFWSPAAWYCSSKANRRLVLSAMIELAISRPHRLVIATSRSLVPIGYFVPPIRAMAERNWWLASMQFWDRWTSRCYCASRM